MSLYCIGDIQGCDSALGRLLAKIDFSPSRDNVYLLGDLVNRGPESAQTLRRCMAADGGIQVILGNHDLHLLAAAQGRRKFSRRDTLLEVLQAPDAAQLLAWVRQQPLARTHTLGAEQLLMVHAGVHQSWDLDATLRYAAEVQEVLRSNELDTFLQAMYGNTPAQWDPQLTGMDRLRMITNVLTRMRFCQADGSLDFDSTESLADAPEGLTAWFDLPNRAAANTTIAFGHWSTLGDLNRPHLLALDTGCVWGGCLTAVRFGSTLAERELIDVDCEQAQQPG
ncbi:symmetrical bis(5'-nucleosyl)-tetraphosphatase [Comamonas piscis]|uniref:bis(5'-nucleosyl)-tetraphosphatase (symmetrical) n=1 Tax=Comamonas piscis TaxID=1562974 RepID=A0A7G5EFV2_9BURK|nr:symmetrical bis(5'-nucleosyl)-tetraphosphatase [Comamonas piscis]QMV72877.1 symmetrical bis(5'-nucleosyl)-tetraphosphatase [Comamonas piscis]WSO35654.1 symmetrical bis(5'-nucleosyl)-tetraphosphatase [Comamonas piscis]